MQRVDLTPDDAAELTALFAEYGWWADRTESNVREALANSVAVGIRDDGELVAAARVVIDGVYYAKLYDVIVAADRRGEGVGSQLLDAVFDHPALDDVFCSVTCRAGLVDFCQRAGFEPYPSPVERPDGDPEAMSHLFRRDGDA